MAIQLAHICIRSLDLEKTEHFYVEGMGLELGFEFMRKGERFGFYLKLGSMTFIEVFKGEPGEPGNIQHVAIQVDCIDDITRRLTEAGYEVGEKKLGADHSWQAWVTDPSGIRIEFHEYTDESLQINGGICQVNW